MSFWKKLTSSTDNKRGSLKIGEKGSSGKTDKAKQDEQPPAFRKVDIFVLFFLFFFFFCDFILSLVFGRWKLSLRKSVTS
jgi:hypothetical protein